LFCSIAVTVDTKDICLLYEHTGGLDRVIDLLKATLEHLEQNRNKYQANEKR
jgi:hypothetical protein